ncbi:MULTISPECIES: hypothetical protein [Mycolicibacter]|uniref:Uncharacterized protein n=2 Tax=Mycolicibacter TaxID=1073531 RepID=A0ABU5XM35_9MYCO|nr:MULTISPECIES: hypothetical protein [unclassified Mycolicibacter]MEB3023028.1 hypothetical protein [Mycolicibacter sp. MYC098]MEB3033538.1 hypothetical protein [Mycolicibacter sp. MYC340]
MARKKTRFELCDAHAHLESAGRSRLAEFFCEGGPGSGQGCSPILCRVLPGTDLFGASVTDDVAAQWVLNWKGNAHFAQ